ncbi:MAG: VWA domain-containing protein [Acidobacteria bacterium]|nr:VWA domain-containing protein [Acidobacteriota bacterium]
MCKPVGYNRTMIVCVLLLLGFAVSDAQYPPPGSQGPSSGKGQSADPKKGKEIKEGETVIREQTDVVTFSVTVTDSQDRLVAGLEPQHFEVFEDKVKQKIEYFNYDDTPVSVGIVFDVSGSMKGKIDRAREALKSFVESSHDDDDFFLIGFNHQPNLLAEFTDGPTLLTKLSLVDPNGQTALYDAVYLGVEKVKQGRHSKRAILLISDGQDNSSRYTYNELRKLLKEANVHIYSIGIVELGGSAGATLDVLGQGILEEISQVTGGKAFFPRSVAELEDATSRIALELRHQYSIGYIPTNVQRDGKWHKIRVRVNPPRGWLNLNIRTKEGYYAVPQPAQR